MRGRTWPVVTAGVVAVVLGACGGSVRRDGGGAGAADWKSGAPREGGVARASAGETAGGDEVPLGEGAALGDFLAYAAANNAGLKGAFYEWRAAVERLPQVAALPDPMMSYGYFLEDFSGRRGDQHVFELSQTFPWLGKLRLREEAAGKGAEAAAEEYEGRRLMLFLEVRRAYYELHQLDRETEIMRENLELLGRVEAIARSRMRVGAATHPDVVRAQVELGRMEDRVRELEQMRGPQVARLNAVLNRAPGAEVPRPLPPPGERLAVDAEHLLGVQASASPRLRGLQSEVERAGIESELARREKYPDVTIGGMYALRDENPVLVRVGVNIPLWREKYSAAEREGVLRRLGAASMRREEENRLGAELHEAVFVHNDAQRRIDLYARTLLPKARESLRASLRAFQAGTAGFLEVLDAERTLLEFQLAEVRAGTDRAVALARLDALVGRRVPREPDAPPADQDEEPIGVEP